MRESESPRSQRVMAEITTQYHSAEALMDKYLTLLENYEKMAAKQAVQNSLRFELKLQKHVQILR